MATTPEQPKKRVINVHPKDAARTRGFNYDGPSGRPTYTRDELVKAYTETAPACHHAPHVLLERRVRAEVADGLPKIEEFLGKNS